MQERLPRVEERVSGLDKDVLSLSEELDELKADVRSSEVAIKRLDTDVELLKQQGMTVEQALREIKTEIKELTVLLREMAQKNNEEMKEIRDMRIDDHLSEPLSKRRAMESKIIWAITAALVTYLLGVAFPNLFM